MISKLRKVTGLISVVQGVTQILVYLFLLAESFCLVNFFKKVEILSLIKILYLYWPNTCGETLQIGQLVNLLPTHALITYPVIPHTIFRNLILTTLNAALGVVWVISSFKHMRAGVTGDPLVVRWPWVIVTSTIIFVDLGNFLIFANDSFSTKTLDDIVTFTGIKISGAGNHDINTAWVSWTMAFIYGRLIIMMMFNAGMVITVIIDTESDGIVHTGDIELQRMELETQSPDTMDFGSSTEIPRPGINDTFRSMKSRLLKRSLSLVHRPPSPVRLEVSSERLQRKINPDFKRSVNFLENFALPQPTFNLISGQKRHSIVTVYGSQQLQRASQSLPRLDTEQPSTYKSVRRDTALELQGQLPWAYIPTSTGRMRDLLPADEELPPVPLPDYNTVESHRKISVHRAAFSLAQKQPASRMTSANINPMRIKDIDVFY